MVSSNDRLARVRRNAEDGFRRIELDPTLSRVGRQHSAARLAKSTQVSLDKIKADDLAASEEAKRSASEKLWHSRGSGDVAGYRDALDRAEKAESAAELEQLYSRAVTVGDDQLRRACAFISHQHVVGATPLENVDVERAMVSDYARGVRGGPDALDTLTPEAASGRASHAISRIVGEVSYRPPASQLIDTANRSRVEALVAEADALDVSNQAALNAAAPAMTVEFE